jgi:hypothetical protein
MAWSVIQQPNGKFAIWCTVGSQFTLVDGTEEDVYQEYLEEALRDSRRRTDRVIARAKGEQQPPPAWSLETCLEVAGHDPRDELLQTIRTMMEEGAEDDG